MRRGVGGQINKVANLRPRIQPSIACVGVAGTGNVAITAGLGAAGALRLRFAAADAAADPLKSNIQV